MIRRMTIQEIHQFFLSSSGVTSDTRNLTKGGMFFALKGANFNGNSFAAKALEAGCAFAVVDEFQESEDSRIIHVENVLNTLQDLAHFHRMQFDIPIIGITGSNGKTTSKELTGVVLSKKFKTLVTAGNLNNHLGVPFTLLKLTKEHELAIIEMGANKPGDIKELVEIAAPTHGIITNIGAAHIEGFGSIEGVIKTKGEMYDFISAHEGTVFYHAADPILSAILPQNVPCYSFGDSEADVDGQLVAQNPFISFKWNTKTYFSPVLETHLVGRYNFTNFLLAVSVGNYFGVDPADINEAIQTYLPTNNRSQITKTERNTLIVDCYNANATSMKAALESLLEMEGDEKVLILGDMKELGAISMEEHQKIVDFIEFNKLRAFLVGEEMCKVAGDIPHFDSWKELVQNEDFVKLKKSLILIKGSRGIRLEEILSYL